MLTCANCGRESPEDFAFCPACSAPLTPPTPAREVRKTVTVVFCDVTGSTAMGERLDPESMRTIMARYFSEMRTALERHGGTVEKFIGDAVMAVFGVPRIHEDDAMRAVRAASEMREAVRLLTKELERDHGVALSARIGVNTGEVVAGEGAGGSLVTGDAVNVAARLEQAATPGEVLIGAETFRLVRDAVVAEPIEPLEVKGKSEPVPAFRLVECHGRERGCGTEARFAHDRPGAPAHAAPTGVRRRGRRPLVPAVHGARYPRDRQVSPDGGVPGWSGCRALRGRCLPYGDGITFFPVAEVVKEAAGLETSTLRARSSGRSVRCSARSRHRSAPPSRSSLASATTRVPSRRRSGRCVVSWRPPLRPDPWRSCSTTSTGGAHVPRPDRAHRGLVPDAPILVVCMARPDLLDLRPAWGGGKLNAATILLERLSDDECVELVANLLRRASLPDELAPGSWRPPKEPRCSSRRCSRC